MTRIAAAALIVLAFVAAACGSEGSQGQANLSGSVEVDGSSTVFPISEAIAEEFKATSPDVNVKVGQSGTGGGFKKFCNGETDLSDASRPIEGEEKEVCASKDISYIELKIAIDGLSVVVNKDNQFVDCLTVEELKKIWEPNSAVTSWKDVRTDFPDQEIKLYGPGADSGTFDYFTKEINGEEKASRSDYTASEDDNVLVQGVGNDRYALGYFGFAYYEQNTDKLKALGVDAGAGCVEPGKETIEVGTYKPLSRPLYIYASAKSLERAEVEAFVQFYVDTVNTLLADVGYISLPSDDFDSTKETLSSALA